MRVYKFSVISLSINQKNGVALPWMSIAHTQDVKSFIFSKEKMMGPKNLRYNAKKRIKSNKNFSQKRFFRHIQDTNQTTMGNTPDTFRTPCQHFPFKS